MMPITVPVGFFGGADLNPRVTAENNAASSSAFAVAQIRASTNCVRAKAKCSSVEIGAKCERCERMKKDCQPSPSVRKRRTVKRVQHTSRTSKIEQKLDGLVQLLESAAKPVTTTARAVDGRSASSTSPNAFLPSLNNDPDIIGSDYTHNNPVESARAGHHSLPTPASLSESASLTLQPAIQSNWELSIQDAELNLTKFRTDFVKHIWTIENPKWGQALVRETLDLPSILDEVDANFSRVKDDAGLNSGGLDDIDPCTLFAIRIRKAKGWWDATAGNPSFLEGDDAALL